ncbi:MAG: co-chaperone GroES [Candidatus Daviesbacteria bacterium]|nr:MAG: co-chaperone GroES [Candidatus Daviesbacteria bacterium]
MPKTKKIETKIKVRPLMGYCLVEPLEAETQTTSGIILPESAQEKPAQGKVLAVAENSPVRVGEVVIYKKWGGDEIKIDGVEYKLVKFDDLMAIIE